MLGEAPDIAEMSYTMIGSYVEQGVVIDITKYLDAERLAGYDQNALDYMTLENTLYGLPLYITIQALSGNCEMLEVTGADVAKIQTEGWSCDEFMQILVNGTTEDCFCFVFANDGVAAPDFLNIFGITAGLINAFTADYKYAYTFNNMLEFPEAVEAMCSPGYMPNYVVAAGQRLVMCQTVNAMFFGKVMPLFENNINANNAELEANDATAVENRTLSRSRMRSCPCPPWMA